MWWRPLLFLSDRVRFKWIDRDFLQLHWRSYLSAVLEWYSCLFNLNLGSIVPFVLCSTSLPSGGRGVIFGYYSSFSSPISPPLSSNYVVFENSRTSLDENLTEGFSYPRSAPATFIGGFNFAFIFDTHPDESEALSVRNLRLELRLI